MSMTSREGVERSESFVVVYGEADCPTNVCRGAERGFRSARGSYVRRWEGEVEADLTCTCDFAFGGERARSATAGVFARALGADFSSSKPEN